MHTCARARRFHTRGALSVGKSVRCTVVGHIQSRSNRSVTCGCKLQRQKRSKRRNPRDMRGALREIHHQHLLTTRPSSVCAEPDGCQSQRSRDPATASIFTTFPSLPRANKFHHDDASAFRLATGRFGPLAGEEGKVLAETCRCAACIVCGTGRGAPRRDFRRR